MAITGSGPGGATAGVGGGGLGLRAGDFYPSWGPSRYEALKFTGWVIVEVLPLAFPGGAMISGIRRAGYLRNLYKAGRGGDKLFDTAKAIDKAGEMRTGTILFATAYTGGALSNTTYAHHLGMAFQATTEVTIMYYRDREGRIRAIVPSDRVVNQLWGQSRGVQGEVLPAARRTAESFFDKDGLQRLSSFKRPRTPIPKWSFTTRSRKGLDRGNPLAEGPGSHARRASTRRGKQISPKCPVHKRRHWCNVTRAMF